MALSGDRISAFSPEFAQTEAKLSRFGVEGADLAYAANLYQQFLHPTDHVQHLGENFIPSALLSAKERTQTLGAQNYELLAGQKSYLEAAKNTTLVAHPMDGGTGSSVGRSEMLTRLWPDLGRVGTVHIGAKGTDLFFTLPHSPKPLYINIMEAKYLRLMQDAPSYQQVIVQELLNTDSQPSFEEFLSSPVANLSQRRNTTPTYYDQLASFPNISVAEPILQANLPTIDVATRQLTTQRVAPGSHGQLGTALLLTMAAQPTPENNRIHAIYNGDGVNNGVSPEMVGFMQKEHAGIVMVTTTRTDADKKGGVIGVHIDAQGKQTPSIMELAQAKKSGQQDIFEDLGLSNSSQVATLGRSHELGQQYFNTNIALLNEGLLGQFLSRLRSHIGVERFTQIITPELIENEKTQDGKKFTQLEGALASVLFRLNAFVTTDEYASTLWKEIAGDHPFLRIINLDTKRRDEFFTPTKYAFDFWLQAYSDHFHLNPTSWKLENTHPGHAIAVASTLLSHPYYMEMQHLIDTFGYASVTQLDELDIQGEPVTFQNAVFKGKVHIHNQSSQSIDLTDPRFGVPRTPEGRLLLENVSLVIHPDQQIEVRQI